MKTLPDLHLAEAMSRLGTEGAFEVLARARQLEAAGKSIIHLEIGEPDFPTPAPIQAAAAQALADGYTHYTPAQGLPALREAVAEYVSRTRRIAVEPEEVVIAPGLKPILYIVMTALLEPGDEVIYPDPGFPIYESLTHFLGAKAVPVQLREEASFAMTAEDVAAALTPRTRMLILNSPHNPTGGVLPRDEVQRLARLLAERDVVVFSDEAYSRIVFEGEHHSLISEPGMRECTVLLDGFSKTYAMTGWRLGYGVMPKALAQAATRLMININSCTAAFTQMAGVEALRGDQSAVEAMVGEFRRRRDACLAGIQTIPGFRCRPPHGAFYLFPNIEGTGYGARELQQALLQEAGVAVLAGTAFGANGEGFLRISVANSLENIEQAIERIRNWIAAHPRK